MTTNRGGRPRSDRAHRAILQATRDLLAESGYEALTIEAIAARAGVGRPTLYRWWSSKAAVVAEAVTEGLMDSEVLAPPDTGDFAADLATWWEGRLRLLRDPRAAAILRGWTAASAESNEEADRLYALITGPLRQALARRFAVAVELGQIRSDVSLDALSETLFGGLLYRVLTRVTHQPAGQVIDLLLRGIIR
ncbi:TetR/AcrR family transcriptional regulator [Nocardia bovistercoris]|uniref:TetR/AcrR family transcriptional regulator n=1 Tax=Nocardia bovistercoris TaxID=2785916 RepID=A0A931N2S1_9NOCA|nr:TetR/AcrR family transcriptional regulator [Nocardia bovistercoris]MBH0779810.1 TetR/AcrR family transcriptional regulator [Nocardia bovistercoris]